MDGEEDEQIILLTSYICILGAFALFLIRFHVIDLYGMAQNAALAIRSCGNPCPVV